MKHDTLNSFYESEENIIFIIAYSNHEVHIQCTVFLGGLQKLSLKWERWEFFGINDCLKFRTHEHGLLCQALFVGLSAFIFVFSDWKAPLLGYQVTNSTIC